MLAQISTDEIKANSTSAILVCAYLMGAAEALAETQDSLKQTLTSQLHQDDRGAQHLINTCQRLAGKYPFVDQIRTRGRQNASHWQLNDDNDEARMLAVLLQQYQNLSLLELNMQGVTPEDERVTPIITPLPSGNRVKRGHIVLALLALIAVAALNYFTLANT